MRPATAKAPVVLEPAAQAFAAAASTPPFLFELGVDEGRSALDEMQSGDVDKPFVDVFYTAVPGGPTGLTFIRILRPYGATIKTCLPAVVYVHGGRMFGDHRTHDRIARELAAGTGAAVVCINYTRVPEATYPVAIEQSYALVEWIAAHGAEQCLDGSRIAVAGGSNGGTVAAALAILAMQRGGPKLAGQVLFCPATDCGCGTASYRTFAEGYHLRRDAMQWFWDQYLPDPSQREEVTAAPLNADIDQLAGLPPALVITAEADVLRDEGEAYAAKLRQAGVAVTAVRYAGAIHDFVVLNALRETQAAEAAITQAVSFLRRTLR